MMNNLFHESDIVSLKSFEGGGGGVNGIFYALMLIKQGVFED